MEQKPVQTASRQSAREFVASIDLGGRGAPGHQAGPLMATVPYALRLPIGPLLGVSGQTAGPQAAQQPSSVASPASGTDPVGLRIQTATEQTFIVGSQLISFNKDVTDERRSAALNSSLLAMLRASKLYPDPTTPEAALQWHASYVNTLTNIGWVLVSGTTAAQFTGTSNASVDQVLLQVVGALLGTGTAAALAASVLKAVADAKKDDPFITLYESRVVDQKVVQYGAGLAAGEGAGFLFSVVECALEVKSAEDQVLFFKWSADSASAEGRRFDLTIADDVYQAVKSLIEERVVPYVRDYVASLDF